MNNNLTKAQKDFAIFLPAISNAYSAFIGNDNTPKSRMPKGIPDMEMFNYFDDANGLFTYDWSLYSAGHANLTRRVKAEAMIHTRAKNKIIVCDSGGYQIGRGRWKADWTDPKCPKALKYRTEVFNWLQNTGEYSMVLDIPVWTCDDEIGSKNANIKTYEDAVVASVINHEYFIKNNTGKTKFLNVLQGRTEQETEHWYNVVKDYNNQSIHKHPFRGWAMGGAMPAQPGLLLKKLCIIINDGFLNEDENDLCHVLGNGKIIWGLLLTDIQRAIRKYHNPKFTITFDAASPFLTTANGGIYYDNSFPCFNGKTATKWSFLSEKTIDNKALFNDSRKFIDAVLQDGVHKSFLDSPISDKLIVSDICRYSPTCKNKINKIGKTSWDSFSYMILMAHNVWMHINAIQEANRKYDSGCIPPMLIHKLTGDTFRDVCDEIFSTTDLKKQFAIIERNSKLFAQVSGNRGLGGKNTINAMTQYNNLFGE